MKKFSSLLCMGALISSLATSANAESPKSLEEFDLFASEIFSLSKRKEDAFDAASATYVLTSNDIRRSGATSIPEALRMVPGLQVARIDSSKWAITSRGFNQQFSNKLLILVDGRTVYTPLFSGAFWDVQDYVLEDVEKIEVIRGPGGTIWGANAVNGIINIITKDAVLTQGAYGEAIVGNKDQNFSVRYGGKVGDSNHYRIYAKQTYTDSFDRLNSGGRDNDSGHRNSRAGFRYDVDSIKDNKLSLYGDVREGKVDNYFQSSIAPADNKNRNDKESKGANFTLNWDKTISKKSSFTLKTYFDYDQFNGNLLSRSAKTYDVDFQHFYDFNRENQFAWGAGYRLIEDEIKEDTAGGVKLLNYEPDERKDEIFSAFIQDKIGLIPDSFYLTLGSKFEHNDFTGFEYQPSAKFTIYPASNQTLWASVSQAVRTPTRGDNDLNPAVTTTSAGSFTTNGSNHFDAEKVLAYELGYRIKPARTLMFDLATFYNEYEDLTTYEQQGNTYIIDNLGYGESYGFELLSKWQVTNDWLLELGYDFLKIDIHTKNSSTDNTLANFDFNLESFEGRSPKNQIKFKSNYNITPKIEFDNMVYYVDSLSVSDTISSYIRFDTRIGYLPNEHWEFSLVGQNLTDDRHQEFTAGLGNNAVEIGRTFYVRAVLDF